MRRERYIWQLWAMAHDIADDEMMNGRANHNHVTGRDIAMQGTGILLGILIGLSISLCIFAADKFATDAIQSVDSKEDGEA